ncbi:MAG: MBL fold metallo-hydrolase [Planctomycetota bacterium]
MAIQTGSNGNCFYVESSHTAILVDAGVSGVCAERALAAHGIDIRCCASCVVTHDHNDHTRSLGVFHRKYGVTPWISEATYVAADRGRGLGQIDRCEHFTVGTAFRIGDLRIETLATPHDAADGCALVIDDGRARLGVFTDLGHTFAGLGACIASCDALYLESNYDPDMLSNGPYPRFLQQRIAGPMGHLANVEAAELLAAHRAPACRWACLAHLSQNNNLPELALQTHRQVLGEAATITLGSRHAPTPMMSL